MEKIDPIHAAASFDEQHPNNAMNNICNGSIFDVDNPSISLAESIRKSIYEKHRSYPWESSKDHSLPDSELSE
jgi:hypothetical protein